MLPKDASYSEASAKIDEIITFCDKNKGAVNDEVGKQAVALKVGIGAYTSTWASTGVAAINSINGLIIVIQGKSPPYISIQNPPQVGYIPEWLDVQPGLKSFSIYDGSTWIATVIIDGNFYPIWPSSTNFSGTFSIYVSYAGVGMYLVDGGCQAGLQKLILGA